MAEPGVKITVSPPEFIPQSRLDSSDNVKTIVQSSGAKGCVALSHNPSVQVYFALRRKIEQSEDDWLAEFLRLDGLESLLDSLSHMSGKAFTNFSDAILMLDCVCCIRSVLNRQIGIEFVLQQEGDKSLTRKLITALDSGNTLPKKQVFEMLAVICVYGNRGYQLVQDALDHFKRVRAQSHVFSVIVNELKDADTVPYKTAILTLINCLLMSTTDLLERCRLRTQFEGLQLLDVLTFMRKEDSDEDLSIQLENFHVHKHRDEEELERRMRVNMTDPHQLTREIMKKIFASSKEASLVQILQDLLFLSSSTSDDTEDNERAWDVLKKTVHHLATDKRKRSFTVDPQQGEITLSGCGQSNVCSCQLDRTLTGQDDTTKPLPKNVVSRARKMFEQPSEAVREATSVVIKNRGRMERYQTRVRSPFTRVKTLRWVPIFQEDMEASDACTLWDREDARSCVVPDVTDLEAMFAESGVNSREFIEIQLLEPSTRLQLNLFLERLDIGVDDLVQSLAREDPLPINLTGLKCLAQVLPSTNEVSAVRKYPGDRLCLGMAEQFLLYLSDVSHYHVLLEGHLTRTEFTSSLTKLKSSLKAQSEACQEILENTSLAKFFHLILDVGNFLNYDKFNGNACGFKLETLTRLNRVRSNVPNKTLLHLIVKMAEDKDDSMLQFLKDFSHLDKASKMSLEDIKTEVNEMNTRLRKMIQQLSRASPSVRAVFEFFLEEVRLDFANFQSDINSLRQLSHKVAVYFCESELDFSLQDCFKGLLHFCKAVKKCKEENLLFGRQQRLAVGRMTQLKTHVNKRRVSLEFGREAGASSSFVEDKGQVLENLLTEIHRGNFCPLTPTELTTPDTENMTFDLDLDCLSPIHQVASPFRLGQPLPPIASVETLHELTLVNEENKNNTSVYDVLEEYQQPVDRVPPPPTQPDYQYYSRPNTLNLIPTPPDILLTHPDPWVPRRRAATPGKPRAAEDTRVTQTVTTLGPTPAAHPVKTHHRSRSDLLEVSSVAEKWVMYEKGRLTEGTASSSADKARGDNSRHSAVYSMDLEDKGVLSEKADIYLPPGPVMVLPDQEPFKRTKNRSSLRNFLNKISGAKNKYGNGKEKGKKKEEIKKAPDGENVKSDKENTMGFTKRFGSQRAKKENILKLRNK